MNVVIEALKKLDPRRVFGGNGKPTREKLESAVASSDFEMQLSCGTVTVRKLLHYEAEELLGDLGKILPEATGEENWLAAIGAMLKGGAGLAAVPAAVRDRVITAHTGLAPDQIRELYWDEPYLILEAIWQHHVKENELLMGFFQRAAGTLLPHVKDFLRDALGPELSLRLLSAPGSDTSRETSSA